MFYLSSYLQQIRRTPFSGIGLSLLTLILVFGASSKDYLNRKVRTVLHEDLSYTYFHALVTKPQELEFLRRKLNRLPGVQKIILESQKKFSDRMGEIISEFDMVIPETLLAQKYGGLKVILSPGLEERSQSLIREYLIRLVGETSITLSPLKTFNAYGSQVRKKILEFINEHGVESVLGFMVIAWSLFLFFFARSYQNESYIVQNFQRKRFVTFKMVSTGTVLFVILGVLSASVFTQVHLLGISIITIVMFLVLSIFMRKWSWTN